MTKSTQNDHPEPSTRTKPWYRYAMVWMVVMLPASVVVASMITIAIAYKNAPVLLGSEPTMVKLTDQAADVKVVADDSATLIPQ